MNFYDYREEHLVVSHGTDVASNVIPLPRDQIPALIAFLTAQLDTFTAPGGTTTTRTPSLYPYGNDAKASWHMLDRNGQRMQIDVALRRLCLDGHNTGPGRGVSLDDVLTLAKAAFELTSDGLRIPNDRDAQSAHETYLYLVELDGQQDYVEATSLGDAADVLRVVADSDEEPDSIRLVSREQPCVLRRDGAR